MLKSYYATPFDLFKFFKFMDYMEFQVDYVAEEGSTVGMWTFEEWLLYQLYEAQSLKS